MSTMYGYQRRAEIRKLVAGKQFVAILAKNKNAKKTKRMDYMVYMWHVGHLLFHPRIDLLSTKLYIRPLSSTYFNVKTFNV